MREMVDSGIEWFKSVPFDWKIMRHRYIMHKKKEICAKYNGEDIISLSMKGVIKRDLNAGGKFPSTFDGYQYVHPGELLLCLFDIDVTPRCSGIVRDFGVTSPAYSKFIVHQGFHAPYYNYLLTALDNDKVFVHLSKNLRYSLTEDDFGLIPTLVPPLAEQFRIAAFLDERCAKIDEAIAKHKVLIEKLDEYWWAVIRHTLTKGLDKDALMKDSGNDWMGEIPIHWQKTKVKYFGSFINGYAFKPEDWSDEGLPIIRIQDLSGSNDSPNHTTREVPDKYIVKNGDILISWAATLDTFIWAKGDALLNQHIFKAEPKAGIDKYFFFWMMKNAMIQMRNGNRHGIMMEHVTLPIFENFELPLPNYDEQVRIGKFLNNKSYAILAAKKLHNDLITKLEEYKKSLIYNAVTGKIEC